MIHHKLLVKNFLFLSLERTDSNDDELTLLLKEDGLKAS